MFDLNLVYNEKIEAVDVDAIIFDGNCQENVVFIKTNKRLFILIDGNKNSNFHQVLSITKGIKYLPNYEIILDLNLEDIMELKKEDNFYNCKLKNGDYFKIRTVLKI